MKTKISKLSYRRKCIDNNLMVYEINYIWCQEIRLCNEGLNYLEPTLYKMSNMAATIYKILKVHTFFWTKSIWGHFHGQIENTHYSLYTLITRGLGHRGQATLQDDRSFYILSFFPRPVKDIKNQDVQACSQERE